MCRKITQYPLNWRQSPYRQPLILQGGRQVDKTYTLLEFDKGPLRQIPGGLNLHPAGIAGVVL